MFSTATGAPYSRLTALPYENASSVYDGKFAVTVERGVIGTTRPPAASSPVQSCAPTMTSGAVSALTLLRSVRMSPNSLRTTSTVTPRERAHAPATFSTAALRLPSAQILSVVAEAVVPAVGAAEAVPATAASADAAIAAISAVMRHVDFIPRASCARGEDAGMRLGPRLGEPWPESCETRATGM